jgi:hypothetical protein
MESMPSACYIGDSYPYAQKHDPFIYFNDIRDNSTRCSSHVVPYSQLSSDLRSNSTTPNFGFITPNLCNDMHDCSIGTGDTWLSQQVPVILGSPAFTSQSSLLAITWDEDDGTESNRVPMILLGSVVKAGYRSGNFYNHYSLLHTVEAGLGTAGLTSNDANSATLDEFTNVTAPCTVTVGVAATETTTQFSVPVSSIGCSRGVVPGSAVRRDARPGMVRPARHRFRWWWHSGRAGSARPYV